MKLKTTLWTILLSTLVLSSCTQTTVKYHIPRIDIPAPVTVPTVQFVKVGDKLCVDLENARKLRERDLLLKDDARSLRELIEEINYLFAQ